MIASQCDFEMLSKSQRTKNIRVVWKEVEKVAAELQ
jgi:hypothetical protein